MNPVTRFFEHAERTPDAVAMVAGGGNLTYRQLADTVKRVAGRLTRDGITRGTVVGIHTSVELDAVLILSLMQVGAVSLRATEPVLRAYGDAVDVVIADGVVRGATGTRILTADGEFIEGLARQTPHTDIAELDGEDLCRVVFSSGTTGTPKGVPFTAEYLTRRIESARENWIPETPFMSLLGLDTVTGFQTFVWAMTNGETFFTVGDSAHNLGVIRTHRVAAIKTSPARLSELVEAAAKQSNETALSVIEVAGSLLPATLAKRCVDVLGVTPTYLYGSTEVGTVTRGTVDPSNPDMVGTIVTEIDAQIVDDDGELVPPGSEGILRFRKAGMPHQYWNAGTPTGYSGFRDGWFYPGDYGRIDEDRRLWLSGRRDDLVNAGGSKFNLGELDRWLQDCGLFDDAASFHFVTESGETQIGIGFVTKNPPSPKILTERLREFLPDLRFAALVRVAEIPRNQLGKVNRTLLCEKFTVLKGSA